MLRPLARKCLALLPEKYPATRALRGFLFRAWMKTRSTATVFTGIYRQRAWTDAESVSGPGSNLAATARLREELPVLLGRLGVRRFLDLPCGDFHWLQHAALGDIHYIGADIVPALVEHNRRAYGSPAREFHVLNLITDPLPAADLLLSRDCLVHLSARDALAALRNIARSEIRHVLLTTFPAIRQNEDVYTGGWRPLNLTLPPFSLPLPETSLRENPAPLPGSLGDKLLGLWPMADLRRRFAVAGKQP